MQTSLLPGEASECSGRELPERTGIARLAAESPLADERNDVQAFELSCRTILNRTAGTRAPFGARLASSPRAGPSRSLVGGTSGPADELAERFELSINPYRGCELGCTYCYARYTHHYLDLEDPLDFERKIFVKQDAARVLERDLARRPAVAQGERAPWIALGTATDPYQPLERRRRVTRGILETLARRDGVRLSITTKSDLVLRDVDVLSELARRGSLRVNVSITTTDRDLARRLEPRAPVPEKRLRAVEELGKAGLRAGVFAMPLLPGLTDGHGSLRSLVVRAKEVNAQWLTAGILFLKPAARDRFLPWLAQEFPDLVPLYRRLYRGAYPPANVADRARRLVRALRWQYRLPQGDEEPEERRRPEPRGAAGEPSRASLPRGQLTLFSPGVELRAPGSRARPAAAC